MNLSGMGAGVAPTVLALLAAAPPVATAAEARPSTSPAPMPELVLQRQHTFTGEVRAILIVEGEVWAATGGGLAIHRRGDGAHVRTLTSADGLPGNSLRSLSPVDETHVLIGSDFGVALVDAKKASVGRAGAIVKLGCEQGCTRFNPVYAMAKADDGVWLIRHQTALERWAPDAKGKWTRRLDGNERNGRWRALVAAPAPVMGGLDGRLVFGDDGGRLKSDFALGAPVLAMASGPLGVVIATGERLLAARPDGVRTLVVQEAAASASPAATALSSPTSDGPLLVGTATGELFELRGDALARVAGGLPGRLTAVVSDGRRFWLGLGRAGLHLWESGTAVRLLRPAGELCDNHVIGIAEFAGRTVVATFDQGACFLDSQGWHSLGGLPSPMVHGLGTDGQDLYLATSNGLARYDGRMRPRPFGRGDPAVLRWLAKSAATAIAPIDASSLAITSAYGLVEVRRNGNTLAAEFTSHRRGVPLKLVAVTSAAGETWLASETQGVKSMGKKGQPVRHLQDPEDLPENWVTAVAAVAADDLWVGTCQRGVAHVRGEDRRFINRRNLLPDDMVVALAADARGAFIGTLGGLTFASADGTTGRSYGWEAGLPDPRSSALHLDGDELWLGTEAGLARYRAR